MTEKCKRLVSGTSFISIERKMQTFQIHFTDTLNLHSKNIHYLRSTEYIWIPMNYEYRISPNANFMQTFNKFNSNATLCNLVAYWYTSAHLVAVQINSFIYINSAWIFNLNYVKLLAVIKVFNENVILKTFITKINQLSE